MTIREFTAYLKKYDIKYNFDLGEDQAKIPLRYFKSALKRILFNRKIKYSKTQGETKLLSLIKQKELLNYKLFDISNLLVTNGSTQGVFMSFLAHHKYFKQALLFTPTYPLYFQLLEYFSINYEEYNLEKNCFNLTYDIFLKAIDKKTNLVFINTPNNPTGRSYDLNELKKIITYCYENKIFLIVDQVYSDFNYYNSSIKLPILEGIVYIKSFSKSYNLTGCRLGYVISDSLFINKLIKLQNLINISSSVLIQDIGISSLEHNSKLLKKYTKNRDFIEQMFKKNNVEYSSMQGSFYCFINVKKYRLTDFDLAIDIARKKHISLLPGSLFHQNGYLRLSYACSYRYLKKGIEELIKYFNESENIQASEEND